jgi:site-specific DNA recombinase
MRAVGYARVSTEEQRNSGLSLGSQKSKLEDYCRLYEHDLVEIVSESASGKDMRRDGLEGALKALQEGKADALIVAKLDRLSRSVKDMGYLLETFFQKRFTLIVVQEQVDTSTAAGRLVLNVLMSVAQWEREAIGERTRDALCQKRNEGRVYGPVPFGYRREGDSLVEDENEKRAVTLILELRAKGWNYTKIAEPYIPHPSGRMGMNF